MTRSTCVAQPIVDVASQGARPFRDHRRALEGVLFRYPKGCPWREVPGRFGPWKTLWKRPVRLSNDRTWDRILEQLLSQADVAGQVDWQLSIDPTVSRVH